MTNLFEWDIYEINSSEPIHGVKFRGRLRKKALTLEQNVLTENATDKENAVRFAVPHKEAIKELTDYLTTIVEDLTITKLEEAVKNPVLSKMKINIVNRYEL